MSIIGGLEVHRAQLTFDGVDRPSGEAHRRRIAPATRAGLRAGWGAALGRGRVRGGGLYRLAVCGRGGPGGRVPRPPGRAGRDQQPARSKRQAKTDRSDARLLRELLEQGRLPCSWIPPGWILDLGTTVRLGKTLVDQRPPGRSASTPRWSTMGAPSHPGAAVARDPRLAGAGPLPPASRQALAVALGQIDGLDAELDPIDRWLGPLARRAAGLPGADRHPRWDRGHHRPTILGELAMPAGSPAATRWSGPPGWTSPSLPPMASAAPGSCPARPGGVALGAG
jgi:transposase